MLAAQAHRWAEGYVETFYRQLHVLRTMCAFTHSESMDLTRSERGDYIDTANRLAEEARARSQRR